MLRKLWIGLWVAAVLPCGLAQASSPTVAGNFQGLELAQQTDSNPAVFVGLFSGKIGGYPAFGVWGEAVNHETPLPDATGETIQITSGNWQLHAWVLQGFRLRRVDLTGTLAGTLGFHSTDLFDINCQMNVTGGGSGTILLSGTLNHTVFPPAVQGALSQP